MAELALPLRIFRYQTGRSPHFDTFTVRISETATVLDAIETVWARHDRTLTFRHACHHASCGSCGLLVNGIERLPCITGVRDVWDGHGSLRIEPLRNFPIVSDLVVDAHGTYERMRAVNLCPTTAAESIMPVEIASTDQTGVPARVEWPAALPKPTRFDICIECGLCMSACPTMATDDRFLGPMALAALARARQATDDPAEWTRLLGLADGEHGAWRCHCAFECLEACPQGVDLPGMIMSLRRDLARQDLKKLVGRRP